MTFPVVTAFQVGVAGTINRNIGYSADLQWKKDYRYENSKIDYFK